MEQFENTINEDRFIILEHMATEIRKKLLGTLILAKVIWKDELVQKEEGMEIMRIIEEAEEAFIDASLTNRFDRLENILTVIHARAKGIFLLMEYIAKEKQKNRVDKD